MGNEGQIKGGNKKNYKSSSNVAQSIFSATKHTTATTCYHHY